MATRALYAPLNERETHSLAFTRKPVLQAAERQKHSRVVSGIYTKAIVMDLKSQSLAGVLAMGPDRSSIAVVVLDGIVDQVAQHEIEWRPQGIKGWPHAALVDDKSSRTRRRSYDGRQKSCGIDKLDNFFLAASARVFEQ